jgi:NADH-quinone oxidoreductase subunit F
MVHLPLTQAMKATDEALSIDEYQDAGGYAALRTAVTAMTPGEVVAAVTESNLKGRGGAGFPTGKKWSFVPRPNKRNGAAFLVVNADEMEPGTFKDRLLLERNPHLVLEGALAAAFAIQADTVYLFVRWAYKKAAQRLTTAIAEARGRGYIGDNIFGSRFCARVHVHTSFGRYMCGEETGLLNALAGKRASPRGKPPFPQVVGLCGRPTVVNNVETVCNVPPILAAGSAWFKSLSKTGDSGTKLYGASGRVRAPGLWELPMGTTAREIIEKHAGGVRSGYSLRGFLPGGASTDFLTNKHLDVPMDFDAMQGAGSRLGTGTVIVLDDRTCPVAMVHNLVAFFARESCGWCTPCRDGLPWTRNILDDIEHGKGRPEDLDRLELHCKLLGPGRTFCALAPGAMEPLQSALKYFREDFERHIAEKRCPYKHDR